jgi:hypothetical protein
VEALITRLSATLSEPLAVWVDLTPGQAAEAGVSVGGIVFPSRRADGPRRRGGGAREQWPGGEQWRGIGGLFGGWMMVGPGLGFDKAVRAR